MKNLFFILILLFLAFDFKAQIKVEPIAGIGIDLTKKEQCVNADNSFILNLLDGNKVKFNNPCIFQYDITMGFKAYLTHNFYLESENKFFIYTDNFIQNYPYNIEFYLRLLYKTGKLTFGLEHMCKHKINSNGNFTNYNIIGGYDRIEIKYNF